MKIVKETGAFSDFNVYHKNLWFSDPVNKKE